MQHDPLSAAVGRRTLLKGLVLGAAAQVSAPFILKARGEERVRIGLDNPLTGTYAALGKNERIGCEYAVEEINAKGGIIGRPVELLVEDSTSGDTGTAVQKARKLIDRDKVSVLIGNVNSAMALATGQVSNELKTLHIVPGGHTDAVTGKDCHWNVFRVCNTTEMEANAASGALITNAGKKWYYITPDYAYGHTLQAGLEKAAAKLGGTKVGGDLTPLGTTDFSAYLINAQSANPDVIIFLLAGDDAVNGLKQAVQFGLDKSFHLAGAQQELEVLEGLPPEARVGTWVFEWYWKQPDVPHVNDFVAGIRKKTGKVPTARTWFGYTAAWTYALIANQEKTLDAVKLAKALGGFKLPPEVALMPGSPFYRASDHQLIPSLFVGHAQSQGDDPEDLFHVDQVVDGTTAAPPEGETGCKMNWNI
ncbi:MAG: ABC transporter substrate-binding protein [Methylobacteriaceae bacterium]|nr:ABC transporter substrate-binding protein [Methylobacteriaceae bacterium]